MERIETNEVRTNLEKAQVRRDPEAPLFRARALDAYAQGLDAADMVEVVSTRGSLSVWLGLLVLVAALAAGLLLRIEVTATARGALVGTEPARTVHSEAPGRVVALLARSGDKVQAGQPLLRLDSAELQARELAANRQLASANETLASLEGLQASLHASGLAQLDLRMEALKSKVSFQGRLRNLAGREVKRFDALLKEGVTTGLERDGSVIRWERSGAELADATDLLAELAYRRTELVRLREQELVLVKAERSRALGELEAVKVLLGQVTVSAPMAGILESLDTRAGQLVAAGETLAKVVPDEQPRHVMVLLSERDRAFVKSGTPVQLELDGFPRGEFGRVLGWVQRVAVYPATPREVADLIGDGSERPAGAVHRVTIELDPLSLRGFGASIRVGTGATARLELRRQSPLSLVTNTLVPP